MAYLDLSICLKTALSLTQEVKIVFPNELSYYITSLLLRKFFLKVFETSVELKSLKIFFLVMVFSTNVKSLN